MTSLIAIDPGTRALGFARFEAGTLAGVLLLRAKSMDEMLDTIVGSLSGAYCADLVIERPQVYGFSGKANPNKLAQLTMIVGACVGAIQHRVRTLPYPRDWKGAAPKDVMKQRMFNELGSGEALVLREQCCAYPASLHHNVHDAVEIGLWKLGRL